MWVGDPHTRPVSRWRLRHRAALLVAPVLALLAAPSVAAAALTGPLYPVPGGPGTGHGGDVCAATNTLAISTAGTTWTFGGGTPTSQTICPVSATAPTPFDTTRFAHLYWGSNGSAGKRPAVSMDGATFAGSEILSFALGLSDRTQGKIVWSGSTTMRWCDPPNCSAFTTSPVDTRLQLTITTLAGTPVALSDPAAVGITNPEVGGVVSVTPALRNFKATLQVLARFAGTNDTFQAAQTFYNAHNHPVGDQLASTFDGAFWYEDRPPAANFTFTTLKPDVPITFTATSSDPDGSVVSIGWDFNADGLFQESTAPSAQWSFPPGDHVVKFQAVDNEGTKTVVSKTLTIPQRPVVDGDGDGYAPPADCNDANPGIHPGAPEIHGNGIDENCNGNVDDPDPDPDHDGFTAPADCAPNDPAIHPGATDIPGNGIDENCDGVDAAAPLVPATVSYNFSASGAKTTLSAFQVKLVPSGSTVTATCKPKAKCPKKARKKFTKHGATGTVRLKKFNGRYKAGAVIEVRVTHAGMTGIAKRIKIRKGKAPLPSVLCLPPGASKPQACTV